MDFKKFSQLVMIEQTTFALPFAYIGILFAGGGKLTDWLWCTIALVAARTAGMSFNRVLDARIDAKNPRTADRLLPRGEVQARDVWAIAIASSLVLVFSAWMLNTLVFYLSFVAVGLLYTYSLFKRFSPSSHFYLGAIEAAAPVGGYLAVTGKFEVMTFVPGAAILFWIAGIDILYAVQDIEFDRKEGLHSIPARIGRERSLALSVVCYGLAFSSLVLAGWGGGMTTMYWASLVVVAYLFVRQQMLARDTKHPFEEQMKLVFSLNKYVSPAIFIGALLDVFIRWYL
ncbi:MAG TPA: 4-hydroxybenzoate octaprenyltransferase [Spirochaetota bacterium]|nr:4-hydroxybenzoate octaprenyltransferase [Spirochaetota bacterium]